MQQEFLDKKERRLTSTLALRVLLVNFICLVLPLLAYTGYTFSRDYEGTIRQVFSALKTMRRDQTSWIETQTKSRINLMELIHNLLDAEKRAGTPISDDTITILLRKFIILENISAMVYLVPNASEQMICESSTDPRLLGQNFSSFIDFKAVFSAEKNVLIFHDPMYGDAAFVIKREVDPDTGKLTAMLGSITTLTALLKELDTIPSAYQGSTSILSSSMQVLVSDDNDLEGHIIQTDKKGPVAPESIHFSSAKEFEGGYFYEMNHKRYLAVIGQIADLPLYIMIHVSQEGIFTEVYAHVWRIFALLLFILVFGGLFTAIFTWRMAKPFHHLCEVMAQVGQGHLERRATKDKFGFEINVLGDIFNKTLDDLALYIEQAKTERVRKELLEQELVIGHDIQMAILPRSFPALAHMQVESACIPAKEVGGDFYDCFDVEFEGKRKVCLLIADTSGKGISACLYSLGLRSALRSFATTIPSLEEVIRRTNDLFCMDTGETGMFVTVWIAFFDPIDLTLEYTSLGHLPAYLWQGEGRLIELPTQGIPMGVSQQMQIDVKKVQLKMGDLLLLYTDGISEASDKDNHMFGKERLSRRMVLSGGHDPAALMQELFADVKEFVAGAPQYDDMTLLIVKIV